MRACLSVHVRASGRRRLRECCVICVCVGRSPLKDRLRECPFFEIHLRLV